MRILKRLSILLLIFFLYLLLTYQSYAMLSNIMTRTVLSFGWFRLLEQFLTPLMIQTILSVLHLLHIKAVGTATRVILMKNGTWQRILISWNCLGWQSVIIFLLTLSFGFSFGFSWLTKLKVLLFGLCGTIAVAVARIVSVIILFQLFGTKPAVFFHDYIAGLGAVIWFCFFWWFSFSFLLKNKTHPHKDRAAETE